MKLITYPSMDQLRAHTNALPDYMCPNDVPFAVCLEGYLKPEECQAIIAHANLLEPYNHGDCDALNTREFENPDPALWILEQTARDINSISFKYTVSGNPTSWFQTYGEGNSYRKHMDASPGDGRKLTAVALLTNPAEYIGGALIIEYEPLEFTIPDTQGTVVIFPSWLLHRVTEVYEGVRQSLNMGFYGPPFK